MVVVNNAHEFVENIKEGLVLVDFFATWCGPCKMLTPVLNELVEDYPNLKVVKVDIDVCEDLAQQFRIMSVPTMILFKDGQVVDQFLGFMPKELLADKIKPHL